MNRIILSATLVIAALAVAAASQAQINSTTPDGSRLVRRIERRLNITDAQRVQLRTILQQERPTLLQLHNQVASERAELLAQPDFDEVRTRAILSKYADTNTAAAVERERVREEIRAVLTPAQRQKLDELRARFGDTFDQRLQTIGDNL